MSEDDRNFYAEQVMIALARLTNCDGRHVALSPDQSLEVLALAALGLKAAKEIMRRQGLVT